MSDDLEPNVPSFTPHDVVWDDKKVARFWDYLSGVPAALNNCWSQQVGKALLRYVRRRWSLRGKILDYGCGPGFLIRDLLATVRDAMIYGLEYSPESARLVNQRFEGEPRFGGVASASTIPTEYDDGCFDTVFFVETIEHIMDDQRPRALGELQRLLRPGGMVVVTTPNEENMDASRAICPECGARFHVVQHLSSWSVVTLRSVMEAAGFQTISCAATHLGPGRSIFSPIRDWLQKRRLPHLIYLGTSS